MRRSIIAAVDGSEQPTEAARVAAWLARHLDRRLVLAHVADDPPVFPYGDRWLRNAQRRRSGRTAAELLDGVADEIGEPDARRRVALRGPLYGNVVERLRGLCHEERTDLMVVGTPVVVVPQGAARRLLETAPGLSGSILYGADGSDESAGARLVAEQLGDSLGLRLYPSIGGTTARPPCRPR